MRVYVTFKVGFVIEAPAASCTNKSIFVLVCQLVVFQQVFTAECLVTIIAFKYLSLMNGLYMVA